MGALYFLLIGMLVVWHIHAFLVLINFEMIWIKKLLWAFFIFFVPLIGSTTFLIWHIFEVKRLRKGQDNDEIE